MDEIEYKLNTSNSILVVNGIDKLISTIKSKFKPAERQKFVLENEELKYLRDKCSSKNTLVSVTACQGLLALVELGVLEIRHTMSTVVTLLPTTHNFSAIISTMTGLLILDLKSRLVPGQPYKCQFNLKSPQHPFITVLEKNKDVEDEIIVQMHALCTHPDYIVSSNSLELLRPVFLWLTCNPQRSSSSIKPWQLLLSLPQTAMQSSMLIACISCQQICNSKLIESSFGAYSAVTEASIYQQHREQVMALIPMLARISNELIKYGRDPRACYNLLERCFSLDAPELRNVAGLTVMLLADNLTATSALYLHELFNLCLNIISKYEYSSISLNVFVALSLQWLHLPSYLTSAALKTASKILEIHQQNTKSDTRLHMPNLKANKTFQDLLYTDSHLSIVFRLNQIWERIWDNPEKLRTWFVSLEKVDDKMKFEFLPFLLGLSLQKRKEEWFEEIVLRSLRMVVGLVNVKKEVSVQLLPILLYKIANDPSPNVKLECLRALPLMAKTKENVPAIVSIFNKLKANKGVPTSFLIMLYTSLAETQVRCFPYLQELLVDTGTGRADDLKWEIDIAKAMAVKRICELRASTQGLELVSVISSTLNRCTDKAGATATCLCLSALRSLWSGAAVAPASTWRALEPKLGRDTRPSVQVSLCKLLGEVPALRVQTPEYDKLIADSASKLWTYIAESNYPEVVEAACDALANFKIDDYKLKQVPEVYRRTVKLPASYCKTPADAARRPEDVLDYVPCEVWPEVFKYTNQAALGGASRLVARLMEREVRAYRSGVYQPEGRGEPHTLAYLPPTSVVRGMLDCFKKQMSSPSYEFPEPSLLQLVVTLSSPLPRPLPPCDLCCLHEALPRGPQWSAPVLTLAARQAHTSGSARRLLENYLRALDPDAAEESQIMQIFEILPILCRGMPPNSLRVPIERCLAHSFSKLKPKDKEHIFMKQLDSIRACLECEKIHDANRTLLSQIIENYFTVIAEDTAAWEAYIECCVPLSGKYLERMTSPTSWWEVSATLLRRATRVRAAVAARGPDLVWLNEVIDAVAGHLAEQEYSLRYIVDALKAANPDEESTRTWFLQLMARSQVAFTETEDINAKLYLCDVFMLSVIVFSGNWPLLDEGSREGRQQLLPAAVACLLHRDGWNDCSLQCVEWLSHTRAAVPSCGAAAGCRRALLSLRHLPHFRTAGVWTKLESHFGRTAVSIDD